MLSIGALLGGLPSYISLEIDAHAAITRKDVDGEITLANAPIVVSLSDLKDEVHGLSGKIDELAKIKQ